MSKNEVKLNLEFLKENLTVGELITYKRLCEILGQKYYKGGTQKEHQLKEFGRYFDFEKMNRKLLIKEIYDKPKEFEVQSVNSIYTKYIEYILMYMLANTEDTDEGHVLYITSTSLWQRLGMINENFLNYNNNRKELAHDTNVKNTDVDNFYDRCDSNLRDIIRNSLNSLQNKCYIKYSKPYMIGEQEPNGFIRYREAKDYETEYILANKRKLLNELNCDKEWQVHKNHKDKEYYPVLDQIFYEEQGWVNVYEMHKIIYIKDEIIKALPKEQIKLQRMGLNEKVIERMNKQAEDLYENRLEDKSINKYYKKHYYKNYVDSQYLLSDKLLKIN